MYVLLLLLLSECNRVLEFNKFDLYTKEDGDEGRKDFDIDQLWDYYGGLLAKFNLGGELEW
jgi:hypothetical protein